LECCKKTSELAHKSREALEPLQSWQELAPEDEESDKKKAKVSSGGWTANALPLWLGAEDGHVPPPPLCGRVAFPGEARIILGDLVAANTNFNKPKGI
jgi:hypothetical protein